MFESFQTTLWTVNPCLSNRTKDKKSWTESGILGRFARLKNNSCEVEIVKALSSRSVLPIFPVTFCIKNIKIIENNRNALSKEIICALAWFWKSIVGNSTNIFISSFFCYGEFKPFHVIGMIFSDVILGWYRNILGQKFVMIIGKQTSYWSKTVFFLSLPAKKVGK